MLKSYAKTTAACSMLTLAALALATLTRQWMPPTLASVAAALGAVIASGAAILAVAGLVVLARYRRARLGRPDLFLELNRSRAPSAIAAARPAVVTAARRSIARRLLGQDLIVGDLVEVKTWPEVHATLDQRGCLEELPFMPEMLALCGQRARVFRCVHRVFDYRKSRRMRHLNGAVLLVGVVCDGSHHGGCEAACHAIWKSAWLRRVERTGELTSESESSSSATPPASAVACPDGAPTFGTDGPRYACQLTQLHAASLPIAGWSLAEFLRPLVSGNVAPAAFAVGWLTHLFNELQQLRRGVAFPEFETAAQGASTREGSALAAGDRVVVRHSADIRMTLNDRSLNRGLYFEPDMLKHCGHRYRVQAEVRRIIDIVTGEMRTMKTPAYLLSGIHFSGERQLFNAQHEPLFWRSAWLARDDSQHDEGPGTP